jgi:hypothetical protein
MISALACTASEIMALLLHYRLLCDRSFSNENPTIIAFPEPRETLTNKLLI